MNIGEDIDRLERDLRALKIQYDQFFAGALAKQPFELRAEVEHLIRKYSNASIRRLAERFHFNTLVSRFNSLSELWGRQLRAREEGRPLPGVPADRADGEDSPDPAAAAQAGDGAVVLYQQVIRGPGEDRDALRAFYDRFLDLRRSFGQPIGGITFASFSRQILQKSEAVKNRTACDAVRLRLTLEGQRLQLKAVPVRRRKEP
jgi:hypothetical protein